MGATKVTSAERSGGFKVGSMAASVFTSGGNKSVTGLGFKPKLVRFTVLVTAAGMGDFGSGAMDESGNQFAVTGGAWGGGGAGQNSMSKTDRCILYNKWAINETPFIGASFFSMDNDGFTINVNTAATDGDNTFRGVAWEAYA